MRCFNNRITSCLGPHVPLQILSSPTFPATKRCSAQQKSFPGQLRQAVKLMATAGPSTNQEAPAPDQELQDWLQNQRSAARISPASEARTLLALARTATISTVSSDKDLAGFPNAGVIEFVADGEGRPVMILSSLSAHMRDLKADGRASFTCLSPGFQGMDDSRVTLTGMVEVLSAAEEKAARELYRKRHPDSFWIDFGDFEPFRMTSISKVRLNGGFARAATISASDYAAAAPDPIAPFSGPIARHMNEDHADSTLAILRHYGKLSAEATEIIGLDSLGMDLLVTKDSFSYKGRVAFTRPALDRNSAREVIVEMTKQAAAAAQQ